MSTKLLNETMPGPGHLASIDQLILHADAVAVATRNKLTVLPAGTPREHLGHLQNLATKARHSADWLRLLAADIRAGGAG